MLPMAPVLAPNGLVHVVHLLGLHLLGVVAVSLALLLAQGNVSVSIPLLCLPSSKGRDRVFISRGHVLRPAL